MKIFINDIPVILTKPTDLDYAKYELIIDGTKEKITPKNLLDDVLIVDAFPDKVEELLVLMTDKKLKKVDSITFASRRKKELVTYIKNRFKVVKAAGGVVEKGGKNLLIYRNNKWDLPKGKLEKGEDIKDCAVREVEEETGVKVVLGDKICHTWHTYMRNQKYVLKKTYWYEMRCIDDSLMSPQKDEGIDDVQWMNLAQIRAALYESYRSIRVVVQEYHRMLKAKSPQS
ncbi:MAG: NUDIX hydrolase [Cyclobacteriaceae bacterium]